MKMNIDKIIENLNEYRSNVNLMKEGIVYKSFQIKILDGYFGTILNKNKKNEEYEVFSYVKSKYNMISPLRFNKFNSKEEALLYFNMILEIVNDNDIDKIISFCKND